MGGRGGAGLALSASYIPPRVAEWVGGREGGRGQDLHYVSLLFLVVWRVGAREGEGGGQVGVFVLLYAARLLAEEGVDLSPFSAGNPFLG